QPQRSCRRSDRRQLADRSGQGAVPLPAHGDDDVHRHIQEKRRDSASEQHLSCHGILRGLVESIAIQRPTGRRAVPREISLLPSPPPKFRQRLMGRLGKAEWNPVHVGVVSRLRQLKLIATWRRRLMRFRDRSDAGRQLADKLTKYTGRSDAVVLGLPRGGVPVAYEVAGPSHDLIRDPDIPTRLIEQVAVRERLELERRKSLYRGGLAPAAVRDRIVILVDDGLATGSTMRRTETEIATLPVTVPVDGCTLSGDIGMPARPQG